MSKIKITISDTENGKFSKDLEKALAKELRENPDYLSDSTTTKPEQKRNSK